MIKKYKGNFGYIKSFLSFAPDMIEIFDTAGRIKAKAHDLFMQYGLRSVSMDDIANNLGISKKTIYQYYVDKDQLVDEVIGEIMRHNQACCDLDRASAENAVHEVFLAIDFMMEIFQSMNPSLLFDMQKYHPNAFRKFANHKNEYIYSMIKTNIERGIAEELYRPEIKTDVLARYRVESVTLPFNPEFHTKVKSGLADIEEEITMHFLFGLVSMKGYKLTLKYQQERLKKIADGKK